MSLTSPDAKAVVAAVDRLTTQVRRLADGPSTPAVGDPFPAGTCDASALGVGSRHLGPCLLRSGHDGPVHRGPDGETWATVVATADAPTTADDGPTRLPPAVYDEALRLIRQRDSTADGTDEDQQRAIRRERLHNLLARADRSTLTPGEVAALRDLVDAEVREADTVRAKAGDLAEAYKAERRRGDALAEERDRAWAERDGAAAERERMRDLLRSENQRANKAIERETTAEQAAEEARAELEQAQAAINRVRALRDPIAEAIEQADYSGNMRRGDLADSVMPVILAALDGTEQPTGCRCHNGDELCSGCRRCPDICHGCDGPDRPTTKEN